MKAFKEQFTQKGDQFEKRIIDGSIYVILNACDTVHGSDDMLDLSRTSKSFV